MKYFMTYWLTRTYRLTMRGECLSCFVELKIISRNVKLFQPDSCVLYYIPWRRAGEWLRMYCIGDCKNLIFYQLASVTDSLQSGVRENTVHNKHNFLQTYPRLPLSARSGLHKPYLI